LDDHASSPLQVTFSKFPIYRATRSTHLPSLSGTEMGDSLPSVGYQMQLNGTVVCLHAAPRIQFSE